MNEIAQELEQHGRKSYIIPTGGATSIGVLGYIKCATEIVEQEKELHASFDYVIHATSSGGIQAGLTLDFHLIRPNVLGIGVGDAKTEVIDTVWELINSTAKLLKINHSLTKNYIEKHTISDYTFRKMGR
jgi:D-cysteine desulfhydrase